VQRIKHLLAAGVETALNHVITARGYPYLTEYVEFVRQEFGGKVKISFAFVTPQFRALDNIEVMPRLSDVMPYLKRALYRALEIGQPFSIGSRRASRSAFSTSSAWSDGFEMTRRRCPRMRRRSSVPRLRRVPVRGSVRRGVASVCDQAWSR
jgi:hypothetical protein